MNRFLAAGAAMLCLAGVTLSVPAKAQHGKAPYAPGKAATNAKDPQVEKLKAQAAALEKQLKARPKDAALKTKTAEASYQVGHAMMFSPKLDRKLKYRGALVYFRRTLALNLGHRPAAEEKGVIESIYRQMGRPIPQ